MKESIVALLVESPMLRAGLDVILGSTAGLEVTDLSELERDDEELEDVSVVIADPMRRAELEEYEFDGQTKFVALVHQVVPERITSAFDDTLSIYDTADSIREKITRLAAPQQREAKGSDLSPREKDVIQALVKGKSNKEIAAEMNVSVNTVMTHRRNITAKLQIHSAAGLTIFAIATGLVKLDEVKSHLDI